MRNGVDVEAKKREFILYRYEEVVSGYPKLVKKFVLSTEPYINGVAGKPYRFYRRDQVATLAGFTDEEINSRLCPLGEPGISYHLAKDIFPAVRSWGQEC